MKVRAYSYYNSNVGFEITDEHDSSIGDVAPDHNGVWSFDVIAEAFSPATCITAHELRNIALVIDHLNSVNTR